MSRQVKCCPLYPATAEASEAGQTPTLGSRVSLPYLKYRDMVVKDETLSVEQSCADKNVSRRCAAHRHT